MSTKFNVVNFTASLVEVADMCRRREREGLTADECKYISRLSTGLVRICLNVLGAYQRCPPFANENTISEAREFMRQYGMLFLRQLLHLAIVTDRTNSHAYIYFLRVVLEYPHLWYDDIKSYVDSAPAEARKNQAWLDASKFSGVFFKGNINKELELISKSAANRYDDFARDKIPWAFNECTDEQDLPDAAQAISSIRHLGVRVYVEATATPEQIGTAYLAAIGINPFGNEPLPIALPEVSFHKLNWERTNWILGSPAK